MNETSIVDDVDRAEIGRQIFAPQVPRVEALDDGDARIGPEPPGELAVADVERDHVARAAVEQHVGEAAGRGADVERDAARDVEVKRVERVGELEPAAADPGMIGRAYRDLGAGRRRACRPSRSARPPTVTSPARISARARSRDCASPRATSSWSRRVLGMAQV